MEVPVNKDSFLILFLSGPHLAKNSMQLQGTLVFDIHGPNSGHNFFFLACKWSGLINLAKYNRSIMHRNKLQVTTNKNIYKKLGECCMHLHHPYMVPKERSNKKGGMCVMKYFHLHLGAPSVSSSFCTSICLSVPVCVSRYLQSLIKSVGSGGYELFSDVIH